MHSPGSCFTAFCLSVLIACGCSSVPAARGFRPGPPTPFKRNIPALSPGFKNMLDVMCNAGQPTSDVNRDACYGCFARVSCEQQSSEALEHLKKCTSTHMADTPFNTCHQILADGDYDDDNEINNSTVFCDFESCILKIDKEILVRSCAEEVAEEVAEMDGGAVSVYMNTTKCILSKIRCREMRCISEPYFDTNKNYALLVDGDEVIRVLQTPYGNFGGSTCNSYLPNYGVQTITQATWKNATC